MGFQIETPNEIVYKTEIKLSLQFHAITYFNRVNHGYTIRVL